MKDEWPGCCDLLMLLLFVIAAAAVVVWLLSLLNYCCQKKEAKKWIFFLIHLTWISVPFYYIFIVYLCLSSLHALPPFQNIHAKISPVAQMVFAYIRIYCAMALIIVAITPMNRCIIYAKVSTYIYITYLYTYIHICMYVHPSCHTNNFPLTEYRVLAAFRNLFMYPFCQWCMWQEEEEGRKW